MVTEEKTMQEEDFRYDGYQVVRGEFFAHRFEPAITFCDGRFYVNTACLKRMPDVEYIQVLVNRQTKKLVVRPCGEDERDSFRWCSSTEKRRPKKITCRIFYAKLAELMQWNPACRYRLLGKLITANREQLYLFDLTATEAFPRAAPEAGNGESCRAPVFPRDWQDQFGLPAEEHRKQMQIHTFDGYTIFMIQDGNSRERRWRYDRQERDAQSGRGVPASGVSL